MIEATINQGVIQLSEVSRNDEFLPAHTAESTLRTRMRWNKVGIGLGIAGMLASAAAAGLSFNQAIQAQLSPYHDYYTRYIDIAGVTGLTFTGMTFVNAAYAGINLAEISTNKLKLTRVQHLLNTTPARR